MLDNDSGTLTKYQNGLGIDNKLQSKRGNAVRYLLADHLGSTNGLADATGSLTAANSYDSFGNPTNVNFPTRYQFTGREFDSFSGLQYSRARFYDPKLGRFISEDPIGFAGGDVNLYGYVWNQPLRFRDPSGLNPGSEVMRDPNTLRSIVAAAVPDSRTATNDNHRPRLPAVATTYTVAKLASAEVPNTTWALSSANTGTSRKML